MPRVSIVFTLDHELFGDGSGDVIREQIRPTEYLLHVLEQYGAKLTLFVEYGQHLGYKRFADQDPRFGEANNALRQHLVEVVRRGHDVQMHLHPTWLDARYEDGRIHLNEDAADVSDQPRDRIRHVLSEGKEFLEQLLAPHAEGYECCAFRSGAWTMRRPEIVLPILQELGYRCDSTVAPGARFESTYGNFDYRDAPHSYRPWHVSTSLCKPDPAGGLLELPIYTRRSRLALLAYLNSRYRKARRIQRSFYPVKISEARLSRCQRLWGILSRDYYMADFNVLSPQRLAAMILRVVEAELEGFPPVPLVLIGHSKFSYYSDDLHLVLQQLQREAGEAVTFDTIRSTVARHLGRRS